MKRLAYFLPVFFLAACGKIEEKFGRLESGYSRLSFSVPHDPLAAGTLTKGVMIYIYSENSSFATTLRLADEESAAGKTITVPNGIYKVFALGWSGASEFAEPDGSLRCGYGNGGAAISLTGQSNTTVQITMSNSGCDFANPAGNILYPADMAATPFSTNTPPGRLKPSWLRVCSTVATTGTPPGAPTCNAASVTYNNAYVRVSLMGYVRANGGVQVLPADAAITGPCVQYTGSISLGQIPPGNPAFPEIFYTRVNFYSSGDTSCASAPIKMLDFKDGVAGGASSEFPRLLYGPSAGQTYYLINAGS